MAVVASIAGTSDCPLGGRAVVILASVCDAFTGMSPETVAQGVDLRCQRDSASPPRMLCSRTVGNSLFAAPTMVLTEVRGAQTTVGPPSCGIAPLVNLVLLHQNNNIIYNFFQLRIAVNFFSFEVKFERQFIIFLFESFSEKAIPSMISAYQARK